MQPTRSNVCFPPIADGRDGARRERSPRAEKGGKKYKAARAEPIATLFESKRAKLAGHFPELEDQLCGMLIGGAYVGPGRSPDRADDEQVALSPGHGCAVRGTAHLLMVWAMAELMLGAARGMPRIRTP